MSGLYSSSDLRFRYPEGWELDESPNERGVTISLQSPGTMFLLLTVYRSAVSPKTVVEEAVSAMREEYPELDCSPASETIGNSAAIGRNLTFFSLDLTNTCWIRAFTAGERTVLVFAQTSDLELERNEPVFRAICASIELAKKPAG